MPNYPVINFLVRHGNRFAIAVALIPVVAGFYLGYAFGGWPCVVGGIVAGAVLYIIAKSYVELVAIIADMLLPK